MGARAQVEVRGRGEGSVFLYTHWGSHDLPNVVADALDRGRSRWGDTEYLTRIIFSEMITADGDLQSLTGLGIGTQPHGDLDYPPIVVDDVGQVVYLRGAAYTYDGFVAACREGAVV